MPRAELTLTEGTWICIRGEATMLRRIAQLLRDEQIVPALPQHYRVTPRSLEGLFAKDDVAEVLDIIRD